MIWEAYMANWSIYSKAPPLAKDNDQVHISFMSRLSEKQHEETGDATHSADRDVEVEADDQMNGFSLELNHTFFLYVTSWIPRALLQYMLIIFLWSFDALLETKWNFENF
jgi:hypothetical protein